MNDTRVLAEMGWGGHFKGCVFATVACFVKKYFKYNFR